MQVDGLKDSQKIEIEELKERHKTEVDRLKKSEEEAESSARGHRRAFWIVIFSWLLLYHSFHKERQLLDRANKGWGNRFKCWKNGTNA